MNPFFEILEEDKTSRCGVGIYKKERFFVTQSGASKRLSEKTIDWHNEEIIFYNFLIIGGYMISIKKIVSIKYFLGNIFRYKFGYVQN